MRFMIQQAGEHLKPVLTNSAATRSRAGAPCSVDNRVMDRFGKRLRCPWSWDSGRCHEVVRGPDLRGIVCTLNHMAWPLHGLFCAKHGRSHTNKAAGWICMLSRLPAAFHREGMEMTKMPLTMAAWFVSQPLRERLWR